MDICNGIIEGRLHSGAIFLHNCDWNSTGSLLIIYSGKYHWGKDINNFTRVYLQAGKIQMGYLAIYNLLDKVLR